MLCLFTLFQDHNNIAMAEPSTSDAVVQEPTKKSQDYEDLFPKLPGAAPTSISGIIIHIILDTCLFTFL